MSRGLIRACVMLLCVAAVGQEIFSGTGRYSGAATFSIVGSGPPSSYSARTDGCVTGQETGCSGLGLSFQLRTTDTAPFTGFPATSATQNLAGGYTLLSTDPDFHGYEIIASDWTTRVQNDSFNAENIGFNRDSTMIGFADSGGDIVFEYMNKSAIQTAETACGSSCTNHVCQNCITKSQITSSANPASCSTGCTIVYYGNLAWSPKSGEQNVLYEGAKNGLQVYKDTICRAGYSDAVCGSTASDTFVRTLYVDFTSNTPVACGILDSTYTQGWVGLFLMSTDGGITLAMGGGADWAPNTSYASPDSFIFPQTNNGANPAIAFQATAGGTSAGTEPTWTTCNPSCTDGTVTWTRVGNVTLQGYGFDFVNYSPTLGGCSRWNTRVGKIYRGASVSGLPSGSVLTDDDTICPQYGVTYPGTCPLPDLLTLHDGGSLKNPAYAQFAPGGTPFGSGGSACTNGAAGTCSCTATNATYKGAYNAASTYSNTSHDTVYDPTNTPHSLYVAKTSVPINTPPPNATYWNAADVSCYNYVWQLNDVIVRPLMSRGVGSCAGSSQGLPCGKTDGHKLFSLNKTFGGTGNGSWSHLYSRPSIGAAANPGINIMPGVSILWDSHNASGNQWTDPPSPMGTAWTDVPGSNYQLEGTPGASNYLPYYDEFGMIKADYSSQPSSATVWRMAHEYNTGSNAGYSEQNNFSQVSPDGLWALIGSDLMGTRGSRHGDWSANHAYALGQSMYPSTTSQNTGNNEFIATAAGTSGTTEPNWDACTTTCADGTVTWTNTHKSCNNLRGLYNPIANQAFSSGDTIFPVSSNGNFNIFQATTGGTSGGTIPNWDSVAPNYGDTVTDGTVVWTNMGPNTCRSDVFLVDMMSAH